LLTLTSVLVPLLALMAVQTVNGILFFEEYANFNDTQYFMFPIGCVLTVVGVGALAMKCVLNWRCECCCLA
jgi:hypothetical protein